jgi:hypothetical protein
MVRGCSVPDGRVANERPPEPPNTYSSGAADTVEPR